MEQMNIVIVGHVDHGKSTFVGRLLADTGSLPEGKLEQVKLMCERNARPFEYAFLLDALKDEQAQGITIDAARCFFKSKKRSYIIIDAPGHIEFLKNMITGAARAEAALLLIDAKEGVRENSRRHGFMLSLLGIKQIAVLVNKMDLVDYSEATFTAICDEYKAFLKDIHVEPLAFIPVAARDGEMLIGPSDKMPWYKGLSVLDQVDAFQKEKDKLDQPFRFPIQDIYKFTEHNDDRRIVAGTITSGQVQEATPVTFYPSKKTSVISSIEGFNRDKQTQVGYGEATGFTLETQIYVKPGEIMVRSSDEPPHIGSSFKASLFWLGKTPMMKDKKYKLKLATSRATIYLKEILSTLDASDLTQSTKSQIERHDVAECVLQTLKPIAFDLSHDCEETGRFVIIDDYEIAGGGIITNTIDESETVLADFIQKRDTAWEKSTIPPESRGAKWNQTPQFILITGPAHCGKAALAKTLEQELFDLNKAVYYLGLSNILSEIGSSAHSLVDRDEHLQKLGHTAHMFTEAGLILITTISDLDDTEAKLLKALVGPSETLLITIGDHALTEEQSDCHIEQGTSSEDALKTIRAFLQQRGILAEYYL